MESISVGQTTPECAHKPKPACDYLQIFKVMDSRQGKVPSAPFETHLQDKAFIRRDHNTKTTGDQL